MNICLIFCSFFHSLLPTRVCALEQCLGDVSVKAPGTLLTPPPPRRSEDHLWWVLPSHLSFGVTLGGQVWLSQGSLVVTGDLWPKLRLLEGFIFSELWCEDTENWGKFFFPFVPIQVISLSQDRLSRHLFPVCYTPASSPAPQFCVLPYALPIFPPFKSDSNSISVVCLQRISFGYRLVREPNKNHTDWTGPLSHKWRWKLEGDEDWGPLGYWAIPLVLGI